MAHLTKAALLKRFLDAHELSLNEWDTYDDTSEPGHVILKWAEPALRIGAIVVLGRISYTVEIGRDKRLRGTLEIPIQRIAATNAYGHCSRDLIQVLSEIREYRARRKKKSA